jgi:hypothetical protein
VHGIEVEVVVGVDVPEQETFADERPGQLGSDQPTHRAVPAVGPDYPGGAGLLGRAVLVPQRNVRGSVILAERDQLDPALDGDTERLQVLTEHMFGFGLRGGQREWERAVHPAERDAKQLAVPGIHLHGDALDAGADQLVDDAHPLEHVEAAGVHRYSA